MEVLAMPDQSSGSALHWSRYLVTVLIQFRTFNNSLYDPLQVQGVANLGLAYVVRPN